MRQTLLVVPFFALFGCAHKPEAKKDTTLAQNTAPTGATSAAQPSAAAPAKASCTSDNDCSASQLCVRSQCVDINGELAECLSVRVHFPFNSAEMEGDASGLQRASRCLGVNRGLHVTIEGNADERGTEEYNLALGDQRATSVAHYLEHMGVSADRLKTISYGKEKPLCVEHDEACWAQNRRVALEVTNTAAAKPKRRVH